MGGVRHAEAQIYTQLGKSGKGIGETVVQHLFLACLISNPHSNLDFKSKFSKINKANFSQISPIRQMFLCRTKMIQRLCGSEWDSLEKK